MQDDFFTKEICDRCGSSLNKIRTMSAFNTDCICMKCSAEEEKHPDYKNAVAADCEEIQKGNYNFKGIGYPSKQQIK